jgi:hypothetical protein
LDRANHRLRKAAANWHLRIDVRSQLPRLAVIETAPEHGEKANTASSRWRAKDDLSHTGQLAAKTLCAVFDIRMLTTVLEGS